MVVLFLSLEPTALFLSNQRRDKRGCSSGQVIPVRLAVQPALLVCDFGYAGPHLLPWYRAFQPGPVHGVQRFSHGEYIGAWFSTCCGSMSG